MFGVSPHLNLTPLAAFLRFLPISSRIPVQKEIKPIIWGAAITPEPWNRQQCLFIFEDPNVRVARLLESLATITLIILYCFYSNNPIHFTIIKNLQMIDLKFAFRSMIDRSGFDRSDRSFSGIVWPLIRDTFPANELQWVGMGLKQCRLLSTNTVSGTCSINHQWSP